MSCVRSPYRSDPVAFSDQRRILSWILGTWPRRSRRRNPLEEVHAFFSERLTESGKTVAGLWLGSLVLAMIPGWTAASLLFPLLTAVLAVSLAATFRTPALKTVLLASGRAVEGRGLELHFQIENLSGRTQELAGAGLFRAREGLDSSVVESVVAKLEPGMSADLTLRVGCRSRGPTGFAGVGVVQRDSFGLARSRRIDFTPLDLEVAPALAHVVWDRFLFEGEAGRAFADAAGSGADPERIFQGVRPFREGDRLRDLDHKAWARWNQPIVREFGKAPTRGVVVAVDTGCDSLLERTLLEPMIRLAAGIADDFCRRGCLARLVVDGSTSVIGCDDPAQVQAVFAAIPRCGWGRWPKPADTRDTGDLAAVVLRISVSIVRAEVPVRGFEKRIVVVSRRLPPPAGTDQKWISVEAIGSDEVLI